MNEIYEMLAEAYEWAARQKAGLNDVDILEWYRSRPLSSGAQVLQVLEKGGPMRQKEVVLMLPQFKASVIYALLNRWIRKGIVERLADGSVQCRK